MKTNTEGNTITFTFDGGLAPVVFDAALASAHSERAKMHGFEQKIRDAAAIARKQKDGTVITVTEEMRRAEVETMSRHLETSADWNSRKSAAVKENATIRAIADKMGITYVEAEARVAEKMLADMSE